MRLPNRFESRKPARPRLETLEETLKAASLHPEEHRDLVVRIGGCTDYFTGLPVAMQSEIIARTRYTEV